MTGKHSQRRPAHRRTGTGIPVDAVKVEFSPEVRRGFARLEGAVYDSQHFSPDILFNLQDYADGSSMMVQDAITAIANVTRQTMIHVRATGDQRALKALDDLISEILGCGDTAPVTLVKARDMRPGAHSLTAAKPYPDTVIVEFSAGVRKRFAELGATVRDSKHFSPDILPHFGEYATGKYSLTVQSALSGIAHITRETMQHVQATGDKRAEKALDDLISGLMGLDGKAPVALVKLPTKEFKRSAG